MYVQVTMPIKFEAGNPSDILFYDVSIWNLSSNWYVASSYVSAYEIIRILPFVS